MRTVIISVFLAVGSLLPHTSVYAIEIPTGLNLSDFNDVTQILGFNTSTKFLSDPYPMGGYSGFEVGFSTEFINTSDLSRLGNLTEETRNFQYNRITAGKGLYYNVDLFVHFIPFSSSNEVSAYGGMLKWMFYEAQFLPLSLSIAGHVNTINIQDTFINETQGLELISGINLKDFALYFGAGNLNGRSTFSTEILDPASFSKSYTDRSRTTHSFIGCHINLSKIFLAVEIDRYDQPVYSAKLGMRL